MMCTLSSNLTCFLRVVAGQATCRFGRKAVISHKIAQLTSTRAQGGFECAAPAHARNCSPRVCHELVELERDRLESLLLLRFLLFFFFLLLLLLFSRVSAGAEGFSCKYRHPLP
jgi:predicted nucleic acid-binding Zn ribbon protein